MTPRPPGLRRGQPLAVTLLLAMLLVVGVAVGSTFYFSNLVVKREFERLPSGVRQLLREQQAAALRGELVAPTPPLPVIRTGTAADTYLEPFESSPDVSGVVKQASGDDAVITNGKRPRNLWVDGGKLPPRNRAQDFLDDVQRSLLQVGVVAAAVSALLAFLISRRVARPVSAVSGAAARLASGDLSARAPVLGGEREIAALAHSFNDMAENLQALERERQQAVADIAHELRTPIAVIQARLDALEDGVYPLTTEQIALLSTQTQLLTRLVGDLRTLTLADAGRLALDPQPLDLGALGREVVQALQDRAAARGLTLSVQAQAAPTHADPDRVRQITTNLVDNALRHARSRVQVRVEAHGAQVLLHVEDDGPGIPEGSREAVFTRFTRLDASRSRDTGGSGLGLAIVRALAAAHGGQAALAASRGLGGAHFTVTLPGPLT
ncbi:hypothetical protein GCM10008956_23870 [Deinococcus arenae]|uniref:histidine kinase n=1 Tax=Deinococcus arenae TaxID=1452751 RepID=A0A8H9GT55_9DEIO|nr:ATP-binding protein [Deinococcus arenae]GGM46949.1 hypothetical protein GCM10008956_23870 [Deinococcus arenae]